MPFESKDVLTFAVSCAALGLSVAAFWRTGRLTRAELARAHVQRCAEIGLTLTHIDGQIQGARRELQSRLQNLRHEPDFAERSTIAEEADCYLRELLARIEQVNLAMAKIPTTRRRPEELTSIEVHLAEVRVVEAQAMNALARVSAEISSGFRSTTILLRERRGA